MSKFDSMGKVELRAACKAAGISYSKLTVAGMRDALSAKQPAAKSATEVQALIAATPYSAEQLQAMGEQGVGTTEHDDRGHCPHCGIGLSNGVAHYADVVDSNPNAAKDMKNEWTCLGCGAEWGAELKQVKRNELQGRGIKIQKDREERNGIKRPSAGGKCAAVWDEMDQWVATTGEQPTAKDVRTLAAKKGWNVNNAVIEFYQWKRFTA